ncbi:MAG: hypothetical protein LBP20_00825 [Treponema sp.]|nr:hypothetical protein [Treponema sp.]
MTINDVDVKTPNKNGIAYNGKGNAIDLFASSLLNIRSGSIERLAAELAIAMLENPGRNISHLIDGYSTPQRE